MQKVLCANQKAAFSPANPIHIVVNGAHRISIT
jgi:hypothetical protein